jgi:hypothetical protein
LEWKSICMTSVTPFQIFEVVSQQDRDEPIGSKPKFWFRNAADGKLWLYKQARENTGEDWAEKLGAELAALLGLPHATVELATHGSLRGIATKNFVDDYEAQGLFHGNDLLFVIDPRYPRGKASRLREHTLSAVRSALDLDFVRLPSPGWPGGVTTPWEAFVGYLLLDALIGNTDRHHQNWGVLVPHGFGSEADHVVLAPTFDHASSLGRELDDATRVRRCTTRDRRSDVAAYVTKARSALYADEDQRPLTALEAFVSAARTVPQAAIAWLERLRNVTPDAVVDLVARVPGRIMSDPARQFAVAFLTESRSRLERAHV